MTEEKKTGIRERSAEVNWLVTLLREKAIGDIATYEEMTDACGRNVQEHRGPLNSARNILRSEDGIEFETVSNVGIRRLDDVGVVHTLGSYLKRARNAAKKGRKVSVCVQKPETLPPELRARFYTAQSLFALQEVMTREKRVAQIETRMKETNATKALDFSGMLDALKKSGNGSN